MNVTLRRSNRTVVATGPGGGSLPHPAAEWITAALTYYSRKYVVDWESGGRYEFEEQRQFAYDRDGHLVFPIGLLPRVSTGLRAVGCTVTVTGQTVAELKPKAFVTDVDGLLSQFTIYPGQDAALIAIDRSEGGMITAPTGAGKSVLIRMICRLYPKAKIHIVTKSATLADEIVTDVAEVVPGVGMFGGGQKRPGRVTVFIADSLHHGMGEADVVLLDEAHELVAPKYATLLGMYRCAKFFGFTASPKGRHDGRDAEMEAICGPVIYTVSYQESQAEGRVVPIAVDWIRVTRGPNLCGVDSVTRDRVGVWQNDERNRLIADRVKGIGPDVQTMIMVKTIDHAVQLKYLLPEYTMVYGAGGMEPDRLAEYVRLGLLPEDEPIMTAKRLRELRRQFATGKLTKVIANYVWSTGVNFRRLAVLVRADASASEIKSVQIPGRVCRRIPGVKESALLIDCWDEFDDTLLSRSRSRRATYRGKGWTEVVTQKKGVM